MKISIIVPCKNRKRYLVRALPTMQRQKYDDYEIVVVDYNCPQGTKEWVDSLGNFRTSCIKANVGINEWGLSAARNLGYKYAKGEYLCFLDADTILQPTFLSSCMSTIGEGFMSGGRIHKTKEIWRVSGCCIVSRKMFEEVCGYNEELVSWGGEDMCLYRRLQEKGYKQQLFNFNLIYSMPHGDNIRNEYHGNKDVQETNRTNHEISAVKFKGIC